VVTTELAKLDLDGAPVVLRRARRDDVAAIVRLLADDPLGMDREDPTGDLRPYLSAFDMVDADPNQLLVVAAHDNEMGGTMQLTIMAGLTRRGALRANVEAVRVHQDYRNAGLGTAMMGWAIGEARRLGCALVQLTSDASRAGAHRFYERLQFVASHVGYKLHL
jgi:GNAT superfamily N-acetyltransferase